MMQEIIVKDGEGTFAPVVYNKMRAALSDCVSIDDCNEAQSQAAALAVYYKQANDIEAQRAANEIRLRAWRRMAEIVAAVDVTKCNTQKAMAQKVRATIGEDATAMISDARIIQLIKLAGVPDRNFEAALETAGGSIARAIDIGHPDHIAQRERFSKESKAARSRESPETYLEGYKREQEKKRLEDEKRTDELIDLVKKKALIEADEIGLTLSPKAKANLVHFSIMMDRKMHDQLRDAAHEQRRTMWDILREASNYWFVVNGYEKV